MSVEDVDLGMDRLIADLLGLGVAEVYVGVRSGPEGDLATIAAANEFGTSDGHVPERSFLRSTVDEKRGEYAEDLAKVVDDIIDGRGARPGLSRIGVRAKADVQRKIRALRTPPNAASTVKQKGSSNPLIDTGRLRQSIDYELGGVT